MFSNLKSPRVNLQLLQEAACRDLVQLLEQIDGPKAIVLDESLLGPIGLVAAPSFFTDRGIKLFKLETETRYPRDINNIIYIIRPQVRLTNQIAAQISKEKQNGRSFYLYFVPRKSFLCIKQLEDKDVSADFTHIGELTWNFFPIDADIISMEMPRAFRDITIDGDPTVLYQAAVGLMQFQNMFGRIPKICGKGNYSQRVWEHAKQLGVEDKSLLNSDRGPIDSVIILDRSIDVMSLLATQLTYMGLIDEFFSIRNNQLTLPAELFASSRLDDDSNTITQQQPFVSDKKTILLNSSDDTCVELRDKNFNEVGKILSRKAREMTVKMNANAQEQSVQDMRRFVDQLPILLAQKQCLAVHTTIAELLRKKLDDPDFLDDLAVEQEFMLCKDVDKPNAYIEDLIAQKFELEKVLRLICMQCTAASGFKDKVLNYYKRELVQVYGIEVLLTISNLERSGLLQTQSESRAYAVLRKTLRLTVDNVVEVEPTDISYVHSGYAPLIPRIVEQTLKPLGWQSLKSQIINLPGQTFEDFQAPLFAIGGRQLSAQSDGSSLLNVRRLMLIFFVGGCTYAEIAALRFLSLQEDNNVEFIIATTSIVNKNSFMNNFIEAKANSAA